MFIALALKQLRKCLTRDVVIYVTQKIFTLRTIGSLLISFCRLKEGQWKLGTKCKSCTIHFGNYFFRSVEDEFRKTQKAHNQ